jgi:hypothetical protein
MFLRFCEQKLMKARQMNLLHAIEIALKLCLVSKAERGLTSIRRGTDLHVRQRAGGRHCLRFRCCLQ